MKLLELIQAHPATSSLIFLTIIFAVLLFRTRRRLHIVESRVNNLVKKLGFVHEVNARTQSLEQELEQLKNRRRGKSSRS